MTAHPIIATPGFEPGTLVELRDVYDGWSVEVMPDGSYRNRWDAVLVEWPGDRGILRRQALTQQWIDAQVTP